MAEQSECRTDLLVRRLEQEMKEALHEEVHRQIQDYLEYHDNIATNPEFKNVHITFDQWLDIKYNNLKNIKKWTRKRF